ncbi:MAG: bifunctional folylpolyglutamate synthase/dihydrofolate synthase, partial [Psychrobacter sp.]|nr:bifunctional folylpolyglutamate synthase/dihydrofolate synthase [Psychrobacter sp.]
MSLPLNPDSTPDTPKLDASLSEWLNYMQQIHVSAIDMGLARVLPVAESLGLVQSAKDDTFVFTVAGTNGKGSTTAVVSALCQAAGYKTALYQSPHLSQFNERIRINGEMVSDKTLIDAFIKVEQARLSCALTLSFFEMTTLAALLIFATANCDVWVLEVGLGGRLDVVNIIDADMAVITNIGIDHVDWLGNNLEAIGREKAGILRDDITLIYGATEMPNSVQQLIDEHRATCYQVSKDFSFQAQDTDKDTWQYSNAALTLQLPRPALSLTNTTNALSAVLASPLNVGINAIEQALNTVKLAGRFDYRHIQDRHWLFDVAHNEQGVEFLLAQLVTLWQEHLADISSAQQTSEQPADVKEPNIKILFSMLADKDIDRVVEQLTQAHLPITDWYIGEIDYPRAASIEQLESVVASYVDQSNRHAFANLPQATAVIIANSQPQDLIV